MYPFVVFNGLIINHSACGWTSLQFLARPFLDTHNFVTASELITRVLHHDCQKVPCTAMAQDPKTLLKLHFDKIGKGNLIKYESERFGEQNWQAKVILPDGRQFSGDIKGSKKESEKLAAQAALDAISTDTVTPPTPAVTNNPLQINWKGRLQEHMKQSVHYDTSSKFTKFFFIISQ